MQYLSATSGNNAEVTRGHLFPNVSADGNASLHLGDIVAHNHYYQDFERERRLQQQQYQLGLRLGAAPVIPPETFKGRLTELNYLRGLLTAVSGQHQHVASIVGLGGMGKTQLSLAYARQYSSSYTSIFWINAKDIASLKENLAEFGAMVLAESSTSYDEREFDQALLIKQFLWWLSRIDNPGWLLIFDNYDDPSLPGSKSATGYDIRKHFPARAHGSILITTRSKALIFSKQLNLQRLNDFEISLSILSERSSRDLIDGQYVIRLHSIAIDTIR